jgi:hypothetical protein
LSSIFYAGDGDNGIIESILSAWRLAVVQNSDLSAILSPRALYDDKAALMGFTIAGKFVATAQAFDEILKLAKEKLPDGGSPKITEASVGHTTTTSTNLVEDLLRQLLQKKSKSRLRDDDEEDVSVKKLKKVGYSYAVDTRFSCFGLVFFESCVFYISYTQHYFSMV